MFPLLDPTPKLLSASQGSAARLLTSVLEHLLFIRQPKFFSSLVVETLKEVDQSRKCFRMVGGVLVERTVNEVLPALINNHQQVTCYPYNIS